MLKAIGTLHRDCDDARHGLRFCRHELNEKRMLFKFGRNDDGYYNITLNDSGEFVCKELIQTNEITDSTTANSLIVQSQFDKNQCLFEVKDLSQGKIGFSKISKSSYKIINLFLSSRFYSWSCVVVL